MARTHPVGFANRPVDYGLLNKFADNRIASRSLRMADGG
jgi:hypothetical protein